MSTLTSPQQKQYDLALMSQLFDVNERIATARRDGIPREEYWKDIAEQSRLIEQVEHRIKGVIKAAVYGFPDRAAAYNEALHQISRTGSVRYYLDKFSKDSNGSLEAFAAQRANRKQVQNAGLVGARQKRDAMYGNVTSIEAAREAYGFDVAAHPYRLSAEQAWRIESIRENFITIATGTLSDKEIATVLTYANLHRNDALPEMNKHDAVARTLRISLRGLFKRLRNARAAAANHPALAIAIFELCGDDGRFEPAVAPTALVAVA